MQKGIRLTWMLVVPSLTYMIGITSGVHGNNLGLLMAVSFMALLAFVSVMLDAFRIFALATAILIAHPLIILLNIGTGEADLRTLFVVLLLDAVIIATLIFPTAFFGKHLRNNNS